MADNTKIGPIFRGANGGLSDDLFTGIRNSFYYSNDMEIREDAKSIYPKGVPAYADENTRKALGDGNGSVIVQQPKCVYYSNVDAGWIVYGTRNIYKIALAGGTVSILCTMTEDIVDAEVFNGYVYVATKTHLYYKQDNGGATSWTNMAASTDASNSTYGRCAETLTSSNYHPLYASDVCLCVGDVNKLRKVIKEVHKVIQDGFTIEASSEFRFINELGGFIRATSFDGPYGCSVYLWDKVSGVATEIIPMEGYYVLQSAIYNGYQYLLTDKGLGLLNGYQYYLLKKVDGGVTSTAHNGMCVFEDKLYFVANDGIYIYGAKNKNYADVVNLWHKVESGFKLGAIGSSLQGLCITRGGKYVSSGSPNNVPVYAGINAGQATSGEIQTMCYFGTSMSEIKQAMYLRVGYHIPKEGTNSGNIHIYYRTEADATTDNPNDWSWHELTKPAGLYADWDMRSPFATTLKIPENARFQWIQFKFVLTNCVYTVGANTYTKDTNLYSADLYYNTMLD